MVEDWFGGLVFLNFDGSVLAIGVFNNDGNGINLGYVCVYKWNEMGWEW